MIVGSKPIDIDLNVFLINKYGDMLREPVTPKNRKQNPCPGITMWPDNSSGKGEFHDDERVLIEFNKVHPSVQSILIVLSIHSGAKDFRHIQNVSVCSVSSFILDTLTKSFFQNHINNNTNMYVFIYMCAFPMYSYAFVCMCMRLYAFLMYCYAFPCAVNTHEYPLPACYKAVCDDTRIMTSSV